MTPSSKVINQRTQKKIIRFGKNEKEREREREGEGERQRLFIFY
jgi:hypothetical protein